MQKTRHSVTYPRDSRLQDGWLREAYGRTAPEERGEKDKRQGWGAGVGVGGAAVKRAMSTTASRQGKRRLSSQAGKHSDRVSFVPSTVPIIHHLFLTTTLGAPLIPNLQMRKLRHRVVR